MAETVPIYLGFDPREEVGYHTFCSSVIHRSTVPVAFYPLGLNVLQRIYQGGQRDGTNEFIYSRFLIPYLQEFRGFAIFVDGADMIVTGDIKELWDQIDPYKAVQVVKHDYKTKFPRKYVGTGMESENKDYPCKNWSSVMIINCAHYAWRNIRPSDVERNDGAFFHQFQFIRDRYLGELPKEWNWLADEYGENPDAKLLHYTAGIPGFPKYNNIPHAKDWFEANSRVTYAIP